MKKEKPLPEKQGRLKIAKSVLHHEQPAPLPPATAAVMEATLQIDFKRLIAHELKTPLSNAYTAMELARAFVTAGRQNIEELLDIALSQLQRLQAVVADLTSHDNQRAADGLRFELLSMQKMLDACMLYTQKELSGHQVRIECAEDIYFSGDRIKLERAICNLLTNAAKYSPAGSVIVVRAGRQGTNTEITIADQGVGIHPENLPFIFDKYFRCSQNSKNVLGLGLGLFIVKEIADAHMGQVWVESSPGQGSVFFLRLPLKPYL